MKTLDIVPISPEKIKAWVFAVVGVDENQMSEREALSTLIDRVVPLEIEKPDDLKKNTSGVCPNFSRTTQWLQRAQKKTEEKKTDEDKSLLTSFSEAGGEFIKTEEGVSDRLKLQGVSVNYIRAVIAFKIHFRLNNLKPTADLRKKVEEQNTQSNTLISKFCLVVIERLLMGGEGLKSGFQPLSKQEKEALINFLLPSKS